MQKILNIRDEVIASLDSYPILLDHGPEGVVFNWYKKFFSSSANRTDCLNRVLVMIEDTATGPEEKEVMMGELNGIISFIEGVVTAYEQMYPEFEIRDA